MRPLLIVFLLNIIFLPEIKCQKPKNGFEFKFSLIHPERRLDEYSFSMDPTFEVLYNLPLSEKLFISGGIMVQYGINNWEHLTSHYYVLDGMPQRGRGYYSRQLKYYCLGIPLKIEKKTNNFLFNSMFIGITGGRYFNFELTDSMDDRVIPIAVEYDTYFWDVQLGFKKCLYQSAGFSIGISPVAGVRIHHTNIFNLNEYAWYGLGISTRIGH